VWHIQPINVWHIQRRSNIALTPLTFHFPIFTAASK